MERSGEMEAEGQESYLAMLDREVKAVEESCLRIIEDCIEGIKGE